ncbi:MAG TPA: hypothetical protein PKV80_28480 [Leptospiraceae bacterium]|nr:hypothetical protein [Leptospiraceae bacterium]
MIINGQIVLECKWKQKSFSAKNIQIFRKQHPKGINVLVASDCRTETGILIRTMAILHLQTLVGVNGSVLYMKATVILC